MAKTERLTEGSRKHFGSEFHVDGPATVNARPTYVIYRCGGTVGWEIVQCPQTSSSEALVVCTWNDQRRRQRPVSETRLMKAVKVAGARPDNNQCLRYATLSSSRRQNVD